MPADPAVLRQTQVGLATVTPAAVAVAPRCVTNTVALAAGRILPASRARVAAVVAVQAQLPPEQVAFCPQELPQAPQWLLLVWRSVSQPFEISPSQSPSVGGSQSAI